MIKQWEDRLSATGISGPEAQLWNSDGKVVSEGKAIFLSDEVGLFCPRDSSDQKAILIQVGTLFLTDEKRSITVAIRPFRRRRSIEPSVHWVSSLAT
jgi:hypothetical protein